MTHARRWDRSDVSNVTAARAAHAPQQDEAILALLKYIYSRLYESRTYKSHLRVTDFHCHVHASASLFDRKRHLSRVIYVRHFDKKIVKA